MKWSEDNGEVRMALANALNAIENIAKTQTADTGKYSYSYADLGDVIDEVKRVLQENDLVFVQETGVEGDRMTLMTTVLHPKTGQWVEFSPLSIRLPNDAQGVGSALTYARRYSLLTIFGIAPEDDDGQRASQSTQRQQATGGRHRTEAEKLIREAIEQMTPDERAAFVTDFKFAFGTGLADLPPNKHGDALTFQKAWVYVEPDEPDPLADETYG